MSAVTHTRESVLDGLLQAALEDVEQLTCTKERAALLMTDEAVERNAALFAAKPEVGLQEFVDAQDLLGGKFAAFTATVGNPLLISCAALRAVEDLDTLLGLTSVCGIRGMLGDSIGACTGLVSDVCYLNGVIKQGASREENKAAADVFFAECLRQAVEWALTVKDRPAYVIVGDTTPGIIH